MEKSKIDGSSDGTGMEHPINSIVELKGQPPRDQSTEAKNVQDEKDSNPVVIAELEEHVTVTKEIETLMEECEALKEENEALEEEIKTVTEETKAINKENETLELDLKTKLERVKAMESRMR